jgi:hypothetical protein
MQHLKRNRKRTLAVPVVAMALMLGACNSMEKLSEFSMPSADLTSFEWNPYSKASTSVAPTFKAAAASPADYVNGDGSCAGGSGGEGASAQASGGAVALQMTECTVVRVLGAPERIDIGANERGERTARLLYSRGDRPGLYSFTGGQLTQIERVAEAAPAAKPQKKPPAKPVRRPVT